MAKEILQMILNKYKAVIRWIDKSEVAAEISPIDLCTPYGQGHQTESGAILCYSRVIIAHWNQRSKPDIMDSLKGTRFSTAKHSPNFSAWWEKSGLWKQPWL